MKRTTILLLLLVAAITATAQRQRFFNLTVDDISIDSMLPEFTYSIPVGENYADSIYSVDIRYPEFIDMSNRDIALYDSLSSAPLPALPAIRQQMVVERKKGKLELSLQPMVERDGKKQFLVSFMVALTSEPKKHSARRAIARQRVSTLTDRYASHSVLASGSWVKIRVGESGVYQLTPALIRQAGFSHPDKVKIYGYGGNLQNEKLVGDEIAELDDLPEVPTCTIGGRRLFYARGPVSWSSKNTDRRTRNPYSSYGYYFLTESDAEPLTVDSAAFLDSFYPANDDYHNLHEIDNFSWFEGGRNLFENTPIAVGESKQYTFKNPTGHKNHNGRMRVAVTAGINTTVKVALNGTEIGQIRVTIGSYDFGSEGFRNFAVTNLQSTDTVTITTTDGGPARLDYISFTYQEPKAAPNLSSGNFPQPEYVYHITNQDHHADPQADMVIIIPTSQKLLKQAQRLAAFHEQHDSLRTNIVPADELYNEFSSGTPDANAYRRYLKMLYDRAATDADMPKYLLLFGDCIWDNRMLTPETKNLSADDYLLAYESENSFNEVYCYVDDGWFTSIDDGEGTNLQSYDKEDVAVGRFPVTTEADAKTLVDKTISYAENRNAGDWQNVIMFMGDDGNNNLHMRDLDNTAETISALYPGYQIKKVMWDAYKRQSSATGYSYPEVTRIIKQQQAAGALIMDYAGHGSNKQMSHENVLIRSDFDNFTNTNLPLWITASCDIMPFDGTEPTIGEDAILNSKGGAVAFFGTTRTVYANYNRLINLSFMKHVLKVNNGKPTTIGEAQRLAKNEMISTGQDLTTNKLQYSLLGDPALALNLPTLRIVVDSINGKAVGASDSIILKAGSIANVIGHVVNDESLANNFNGMVSATVLDTRELITCRRNDVLGAEKAFQFYDRQKTLYNGSDSVVAGRFNLTFAVPRDINYSDGSGLINFYAVNNSHTLVAHGAEDGFYVNGSETVSNDSIGPSIYCYLNAPSFVNGGDVNATPYFVAEITDRDGINSSGSGIGHDLQLIVDGDPTKTYTLNDNFAYDFGSYTKGKTFYNIPELSPGIHKLQFRAWDMLNNPSTVDLSFNVVKGLTPEIESVSCTNNPATTTTTFIVTHNFAGSNVDVELDVFDMSGRLLWNHEETGVSSGNAYTVSWDLTMDSGSRLATGVYLYRVRLSSGGSTKSSKAKKLIVLGNN